MSIQQSEESFFHRDKYFGETGASHSNPLSQSLLNRIRPRNETDRHNNKES